MRSPKAGTSLGRSVRVLRWETIKKSRSHLKLHSNSVLYVCVLLLRFIIIFTFLNYKYEIVTDDDIVGNKLDGRIRSS